MVVHQNIDYKASFWTSLQTFQGRQPDKPIRNENDPFQNIKAMILYI